MTQSRTSLKSSILLGAHLWTDCLRTTSAAQRPVDLFEFVSSFPPPLWKPSAGSWLVSLRWFWSLVSCLLSSSYRLGLSCNRRLQRVSSWTKNNRMAHSPTSKNNMQSGTSVNVGMFAFVCRRQHTCMTCLSPVETKHCCLPLVTHKTTPLRHFLFFYHLCFVFRDPKMEVGSLGTARRVRAAA